MRSAEDRKQARISSALWWAHLAEHLDQAVAATSGGGVNPEVAQNFQAAADEARGVSGAMMDSVRGPRFGDPS